MAMIDEMLGLMAGLEAEFAPRISGSLLAGAQGIASQMRETHLPSPASASFIRELTGLMTDLWSASVRGSVAISEAAIGEIKADAALIERLISNYIQSYGQRQLQQIIQTSEAQVRDLIAGGLARGEAIQTVYENFLRTLPEITEVRGLLISRTSVHSATQFASFQMALRSTVPLNKVWNSINDERTRDFGEVGRISAFNHRRMDQTSVPLTIDFLVPVLGGGFEPLAFPGDPRGSAGNVINCRCVQTYERARQ